MLTPVNAQITSQSSASATPKGSEGDSGFGALLNDTKARRQSDTESSKAGPDDRTSTVSRQQTRADDAGSNPKGAALRKDSGASIAADPRSRPAGNARQTLSSALEQLQGNRLESRERPDEAAVQRGTDRARATLANQKGGDELRQARLAALSGERQPLEALKAERAGSSLSNIGKSIASRTDAKADTLDEKGKRLTQHDQTEDASTLYALVDTGLMSQTPQAQKPGAGREGGLPARGVMLEQGLRGRDSSKTDTTLALSGGRDQDSVRSDRLFGEILSQRDGSAFRVFGSSSDATMGTQATTPLTNDSPLNTLSALTGQSGANSMAPGIAQAVTTATLPAMDSDQWSSAFERQVINLSMRGGGEARLNMNPLELGPLSISLKMGEQSAQLHIASHHAQVRAAIEAALPQLREAFSASGIELGQTSVSDQGSFQQGGFQQQERTPGALASRDDSNAITGIDTDAEVISISALPGRSLNGGIDLFA
ncbi:flagellar hook-length control protein FliK [Kushneria sp. Sum13]|uniref:flagellar hook-length control protein FliK n=1 Tax=Kushneria sp. Sum13 TaxID=3459196 RepID=UPI0040463D48